MNILKMKLKWGVGLKAVKREMKKRSSDESTREMNLTKANICLDGGTTLRPIL